MGERIIVLSDTHECADYVDRDPARQWSARGDRALQAALEDLRPRHIHWLGDLIDFLPAEWPLVREKVERIRRFDASIDIRAIMGNHDYQYWGYPEPIRTLSADRDWTMNVPFMARLTAPVKTGARHLAVDRARGCYIGKKVLLTEIPEYDKRTKHIVGTIKNADPDQGAIELAGGVEADFEAGKALLRQGCDDTVGTASFLNAFAGTSTRAPKHAYRLGNTLFIFLSTATHSRLDRRGKIDAIPAADLAWLEELLAAHHEDSNIFVHTHIHPARGSELGGLYDWGDALCNFTDEIRAKFKTLCAACRVNLWTFGHAHTSAIPEENRENSVGRRNLGQGVGFGNTYFYAAPSTNFNQQVPVMDFENGMTALKLRTYRTTERKFIQTLTIPLNHAVNLSA